MAEKKAPAKPAKAKPTTAKSAGPAKAAPAAAAKAAAPSEAVSTRGSCTAEKCTQPLRAKGYCRKHFLAWRRGTLGGHHRYKVCSKEGCRKQRAFGGLCAEHAGKGGAGVGEPVAAPAA